MNNILTKERFSKYIIAEIQGDVLQEGLQPCIYAWSAYSVEVMLILNFLISEEYPMCSISLIALEQSLMHSIPSCLDFNEQQVAPLSLGNAGRTHFASE